MVGQDNNDVQAAINAGMELAKPTLVNPSDGSHEKVLVQVIPAGATMKVESVEKYGERPFRKRGVFTLTDAKSFIAFVNREKTAETAIFADRNNPSFMAVFNGNEPNTFGEASTPSPEGSRPGWGDHRAVYACPHSEEWKRWTQMDGEKSTQEAFATFIEDNALDIVRPKVAGTDVEDGTFPDAAEMVNVSRSLQAKNDVSFTTAIKLSNGEVQFKYEEQVSGSTQNGTMEVPQRFAVAIPVFAGTDPWLITARLRWRIERGGLTMWYDFERLFKVKERAFDEARAEIDKGTGVPIFLGSHR